MSSGGAAAAAAHAAMINAVRAFGVIVTVEPEEFVEVVERLEEPLVVTSSGGFFSIEYRYLVSYKGLTFFAKSKYPVQLPERAEIVVAKSLMLPG